jgi:hypothetical protein
MFDEGAPASVAEVFRARGHVVILHGEVLEQGVPDKLVCKTALRNSAILVAVDADMKRLIHRYGTAPQHARFKHLSLIRFGCNGPMAVERAKQAMELIEAEWLFTQAKAARRLWIDIDNHWIKTHR